MPVRLSDYHYHLPKERIALYPARRRDESRLMCLDRDTGAVRHRIFKELPDLLHAGDALVVNVSSVLPARLYGRTSRGLDVEFLMVSRREDGVVRGLVRGLKKLRDGDLIDFGRSLTARFEGRDGDMGLLRFSLSGESLITWMKQFGHVPLPPYINRPDEELDRERYQTLFARRDGSVAAPTSGLHFTQDVFTALVEKGVRIFNVCLHVGPGTFRPVTEDDVSLHKLDPEEADVPQEVYDALADVKSAGKRVVAVGTTVTRALETAAGRGGGFSGPTDLFIYPGYRFAMVDALVTNFHLPRSSLLMLVCAFAGRDRTLKAYREAVEMGYRFYSYGDAMFIS